MSPLSALSRDNLPDARQAAHSCEPHNSPAIGDLMNLFDFHRSRVGAPRIP